MKTIAAEELKRKLNGRGRRRGLQLGFKVVCMGHLHGRIISREGDSDKVKKCVHYSITTVHWPSIEQSVNGI